MFRSRFLALRRADRLEEAEQARLEALFATHAELGKAWAMLQELHGLYLAEDEEGAMAALDRFDALYAEDPLPEFYKVVDTLLKWAPEIFAFHRKRAHHQRPARGHQRETRGAQAHGLWLRQRLQFRGPRAAPVPTATGACPMKSCRPEQLYRRPSSP